MAGGGRDAFARQTLLRVTDFQEKQFEAVESGHSKRKTEMMKCGWYHPTSTTSDVFIVDWRFQCANTISRPLHHGLEPFLEQVLA